MSVIAPNAAASSQGLSARARDLWQASLLYRRLADDLAASSRVEPRPMPETASEDDAWLAAQ